MPSTTGSRKRIHDVEDLMDELKDTTEPEPQRLIIVGEFLLDWETIRVWRGNKPLQLSLRQFRLMDVFMRHPDQALSRKVLKELVWGPESTVEEVTVDVEIGKLRRAIGGRKRAAPIRTVHRAGYAFAVHRRRVFAQSKVTISDENGAG
jgi:DNA-binding response OmpR family regulator